MTLTVPRLELWSELSCVSGAHRFAVGGFISAWSAGETTLSEDGQEQFTYTIPLSAEASGIVREGQVTRIWRSDADFDEWLVRKVDKKRDAGGHVDVVCGPVSYRLAEHGLVPEWQTTDPRGLPQLDVGVSGMTLHDLFQTYLVDNPKVSAVLPWLRVGSIASALSAVTIDLDWQASSAQALVNAAVAQAEAVTGLPFIWRLVRNASASYDITVLAVT